MEGDYVARSRVGNPVVGREIRTQKNYSMKGVFKQ